MRLSSPSVDPFYIFGYGSLLWRPGDLLGAFPSFPCTAYGYRRLFVQRSSDHRGVPEFPGLVATLVHDDDLRSDSLSHLNMVQLMIASLSSASSSSSSLRSAQSECVGLVWLIPSEARDSLLAELDYREKGGYTRHAIKVRLHHRTPLHEVNDLADAIVYTGSVSNPMFDFRPLHTGSTYYDSVHSSFTVTSSTKSTMAGGVSNSGSAGVETSSSVTMKRRFPLMRPRNLGANIISVSKGPSGSNVEYLFGLLRFVRRSGLRDEYLTELCRDVLLRSGTARARDIVRRYLADADTSSNTTDTSTPQSEPNITTTTTTSNSRQLSVDVVGWGSNEFQQLLPSLPEIVSQPVLLNDSTHTSAASNTVMINLLNNSAVVWCGKNQRRCVLKSLKSSSERKHSKNHSQVSDNDERQQSKKKLQRVEEHEEYYSIWRTHSTLPVDAHADLPLSDVVLAGGRLSGLLRGHTLTLWGAGVSELLDLDSFGSSNSMLGGVAQKLVLEGVQACALGHDHLLLLTSAGQVIGLGDNTHGQCVCPLPSVEPACHAAAATLSGDSVSAVRSDEEVVKLATGLHHSAAITADGALHTWGQSRYGQSLRSASATTETATVTTAGWKPSDGANVIDVACGARHTACVDDLGRIWTFGDNRFGVLGRLVTNGNDATNNKVDNQPGEVVFKKELFSELNIKWQKVSSGWHHCVARGVLTDGSLISCGWGRRDLSQYPIASNTANMPSGSIHQDIVPLCWEPRPLSALPVTGAEIAELWCGSEFTMAADDAGLLWACGWNEHHNLGCTESENHSTTGSTSIPVVNVDQWRPVYMQDMTFKGHGIKDDKKERIVDDNSSNGTSVQLTHLRLAALWDGSVACGGGHCMALTHII